MNILIVGSTGPVGLGRAICKLLSRYKTDNLKNPQSLYKIRALVRQEELNDPSFQSIISELLSYSVELVEADLTNPASLRHICQAMDVVITSATTTSVRQSGDTIETVDRIGQTELLNAAKAAGVQHYIYTSYSKNTQAYGPCSLTSAKQELEAKVQASGMTYTILRPSFFAECWLSARFGFDIANQTARFFGDGTAKVSYISTYDVAKFAIAALTNTNAHNTVLEIGGPDAIAPLDLVAMCENAGSGKFTISFETLEQLKTNLDNVDNTLDESLTALALALASGDEIPMVDTLILFPEIKLKPIKGYIEQLVKLNNSN